MAEMPGDGGGERQPQRRQADDDSGLEGKKLCGKVSRQRLEHLERGLIDDKRGERMFAIRQRPYRQAYLPSVIQRRRKKGGMRACRFEAAERMDLLPELMRRGGRMGGRRCGWRHRFFLSEPGWRKAQAVFGHANPVRQISHFSNHRDTAGSFHWLFPLGYFRFYPKHGNTLALWFTHFRTQNRYTLLLEML